MFAASITLDIVRNFTSINKNSYVHHKKKTDDPIGEKMGKDMDRCFKNENKQSSISLVIRERRIKSMREHYTLSKRSK